MRRRNKPRGLKALAALLSAAAIILLALRQRSTTPPPRALVKSESKASEALRAVRAADARTRDAEARAADADHVAQEAKGDAERREELNQALRARAQAARETPRAASAAEAREQASNARAAAAERRAAQAEAALGAAKPVAAAGAPVYAPGQRPSWMTQVDCSAYDYSCASSRMRGAYEAYPMHRPPGEISDTLSLDSDGGAAFRKRVLARLVAPAAPAAAPSRRWWLAATASDEGAVQVSKDPETTRRALEASRLTSLDDRLQAAVSSEGAVPGSTVLPAPLSKRLAWTMMDKKYAHDMLFDVAHMARHVAGFEKLVVVALDEPTTRACAAGSISAASAGASANGRRPGVRQDEGRVERARGGRAAGQVQGLALVRAEALRLCVLRGRRVVHEKRGCALERRAPGRRHLSGVAHAAVGGGGLVRRGAPEQSNLHKHRRLRRARDGRVPRVLFGLARGDAAEARQARPVVVSQFVDVAPHEAVAARPRGLGRRSERTETDEPGDLGVHRQPPGRGPRRSRTIVHTLSNAAIYGFQLRHYGRTTHPASSASRNVRDFAEQRRHSLPTSRLHRRRRGASTWPLPPDERFYIRADAIRRAASNRASPPTTLATTETRPQFRYHRLPPAVVVVSRRRPQASARPSRPSMLVRPPRVMGPVEYRPRLLLDVLAREAWSKRDSHAQASAIKSTATPYSSSTGMGRLMYIFMFLYLFLERAGNPLDFAMMGRGFQGSRA